MDECSLPQNSKTKAGGSGGGAASKLLAGLPSRGFFSSTVPSTNPGGMRVYICDHDTNPPAHQVIKTDQMNILIRSLKLKKQKGEMKGATSAEGSKKRVPERATDGRASTKRPMTSSQSDSQPEGSNSHGLDRDYHSLTVERLRALLKERGLSPKGKKDELVARLRGSNK